ncbi:unnamed protein product [Acidocella sp. C78]|uniref:DsbA family protein n=1 Tax=Acidocella sp. C78 TaxID=1671486 RepID=UPI00191B9DD4|nr:DsbA family protein [Acidocella sp. C78]CAG4924035.1 unnamed protein product [Acidocella sp. C78]
MEGPHLVYFADPMCSWCWGFSPVIDAISQTFGDELPIRLVLGGLRPRTVEPMDDSGRADVRSHWEHVHEASGQPFDFAFFDRPRFVYDTEPPCRAVAVIRRRGMQPALAALKRIHRAFYAENQDVTDTETLVRLAGEIGVDPDQFRAEFTSDSAIEETWADFELTQGAGVRGFPTLIAGQGDEGRYALVTHGFQPAARILPALEGWFDKARAA